MINEQTIKIKVGRYMHPIKMWTEGDRMYFKFGFNRAILDEIKMMQGSRWHGYDEKNPRKVWSIACSNRNLFQLKYLMGQNPYEHYDKDLNLNIIKPTRALKSHQVPMLCHGYQRHYDIFGCEMGTGKTLVAIELMERIAQDHGWFDNNVIIKNNFWYVAPRSGIKAVELELLKWSSKVWPLLITYDKLKKMLEDWQPGASAPLCVIFDECSKIKTPTAQRSQAAFHLAESIRNEHGDNGYVILMSGTPSPKSPPDWWHQCEVACPGFIKEGDINKFRARLCLTEMRESLKTGGVYPHLVTWLDDENKCAECGQFEEAYIHQLPSLDLNNANVKHMNEAYHPFKKSVNEVAKLYTRMKGLVLVQMKKDCLDLPEKQYELVHIKPTPEILRAAQLIKKTARNAISALTLLRELSDGFQYRDKVIGTKVCTKCFGEKKIQTSIPVDDSLTVFEEDIIDCPVCDGIGEETITHTEADYIGTPKEQQLIDDLDLAEDIGRLVVWAGFTASVDKIIEICHKYGWSTLRVDGRSFQATDMAGEAIDTNTAFQAMDMSFKSYTDLLNKYPRLCVVGNPEAGGMGLTFTASPLMIYYSNTFKGEARMQSEDRGHRIGMDMNRGLLIKDYILLATDKLILDNLKKKKELQDMTMGQLNSVMGEG